VSNCTSLPHPPLAQSFLGVRPLRWYTVPIELDLYLGDYLIIIGHNGSGKSTLAKDFNTLLRPTGGEVRFKGLDTRDRTHTAGVLTMAVLRSNMAPA
jgi:ABC-type cobalamin/Fe3+-siderophores transport system ATPase subunit